MNIKLKDEDLLTVRYIAEHGRDATACIDGEPEAPVLVLMLPKANDIAERREFKDRVRSALSRGHAVVVKDWPGDQSRPEFAWDKESLEECLGNLNRKVIWQGNALSAILRPLHYN